MLNMMARSTVPLRVKSSYIQLSLLFAKSAVGLVPVHQSNCCQAIRAASCFILELGRTAVWLNHQGT